MAVAEMSKMKLVGVNSDENTLMDALHKTGAVEIKNCEGLADTFLKENDEGENSITVKAAKISSALSVLEECVYSSGAKTQLEKDGFVVSYSEFEDVLNKETELISVAEEIGKLSENLLSEKGKVAELKVALNKYSPYLPIKIKFSAFKNTSKTSVFLGIIPTLKIEKITEGLKNLSLTEFEILSTFSGGAIISVITLNENAQNVSSLLSENGFNRCEFKENFTAEEQSAVLTGRIKLCEREQELIAKKILAKLNYSRQFKLLLDRYKYELEKIKGENGFRRTESVFVMEAFVPTENIVEVENAVKQVTDRYYVEFESAGEDAPTLLKNNKTVKQFEFLTNMYSVPKYNSLDPNAIMSFFFSLFMGIIVADAGYGLILAIGGYLFAKKKGGSSVSSLAKVLSLGGLFAIPFGFLFDSFLGLQIIHKILALNYGEANSYAEFYAEHLDPIKAFSSVAGISVPTILLWSLLFGTFHLIVGLILKAVQEFRRKNYFGGVVEGLAWALFLLGLSAWAASMVDTVKNSSLSEPMSTIGLVLLIIGLSCGVIFAGRETKGFGKVTKSFVAVYGVINFFSDILSYARLYGLMLSGSQIAYIFTNTIAIDMLFKAGPLGIVLGVIVIIAGNLFNLAMGVLGAYIHDSRLQYVEFFGKFYEGDGELFRPLGSTFDHITLVKDAKA